MTLAMTGRTTMRSPPNYRNRFPNRPRLHLPTLNPLRLTAIGERGPKVLLSPRPNGAMILPRIQMEALVSVLPLPSFPKPLWPLVTPTTTTRFAFLCLLLSDTRRFPRIRFGKPTSLNQQIGRAHV